MNILSSIILGLVEGITEFLPVSSTFHLIHTSKLLQIPSTDFVKLFEVVIQSGAILSLVILYFQTLRNDRQLFTKVLLSFLPTAIIGFMLYKVIKNIFFSSELLMIAVFTAMGFAFFALEYLVKKQIIKLHKNLSNISNKEAVVIGLLQSLAVIPGISRAGIVMVGTMLMGYKRTESAYYSFFLAIPTIFAASLFDLYKSKEVLLMSTNNSLILILGFATAAVSAYFTLRWFISFLQKNSLVWFGVYRIVLGIVLGICFYQ